MYNIFKQIKYLFFTKRFISKSKKIEHGYENIAHLTFLRAIKVVNNEIKNNKYYPCVKNKIIKYLKEARKNIRYKPEKYHIFNKFTEFNKQKFIDINSLKKR